MWDVKACRSCLCTKGKLEKIGEASKRIYAAITGIEIHDGDGYPTYFCVECRTHIRKTLALRRRSRRAYFVMKEIMLIRKQVTFNDIIQVNRRRTNLSSSLGLMKTMNNVSFIMDNSTDLLRSVTQQNDSTFHITDIVPDVDGEPDDTEQTVNEPDEECHKEVEAASDIDMTDVFKGLSDQDDNESLEDEQFTKVKKKRKHRKKLAIVKNSEVAHSLVNCKIRLMDVEEQKATFFNRMNMSRFKIATYKCALCLYIFKNMDQLLEHVTYHNKSVNGRYMCAICKSKANTEEELDLHNAEHHIYEYTCNICNKKEFTLVDTLEHMKHRHPSIWRSDSGKREPLSATFDTVPLHPAEFGMSIMYRTGPKGRHVCKTCNIGYKLHSTYRRHVARHRSPESPHEKVQCDICGIWLNSALKLAAHCESWHTYKFHCKYCSEVLYNKMQANHHKLKHRIQKKTDWTCDICFKQFKSDAGVVFHKYGAHYNEVYRYHCGRCGHALSSQALLYQHQLADHACIILNDPVLLGSQYKCKHCNVYFKSQKALDNHVIKLQHPEAKDIELKCIPCKRIFDSDSELSVHVLTCKFTRYPKQCRYCEFVIENSSQYTYHYTKEHPELQYVPVRDVVLCELCGKSLRSNKLATHMRTHQSVSVGLECQCCQYSCVSIKQYILHMLSHTHRPYHCRLCNAKFRYRAECRDHILKTHAPVRPYNCDYCDREFSHVEFLNTHLRKIHEVNTKRRSPKKRTKLRGRLCVYPHMKINLSLVDEKYLEQSEIEISDYLDKTITILEDYSDHIVTDMPEMEGDSAQKKRKRNSDNPRKRAKVDSRDEDPTAEAVGTIVDTASIDKEIDLDVDSNQTLEIIEEDGEQYVMIEGVLYKIERDDNQDCE